MNGETGQIINVLRMVMPVIVMIGIGIYCRAKALISREGIDALKTVVFNFALPAMLLGTFAASSYTATDVLVPLLMYAVCFAAWILGKLCAKLLRMSSRFVPFLTTGFEAGMLGYPLFNMLFGAERTVELARIDLGACLFVFTLYKILIGMEGDKRATASGLLKDMLTTPVIIAIIAGVLLGASGLYRALAPSGVSGVLRACTDFVAAPTGAVILLTIGYDLVLRDIPWKPVIGVVALRFAILMVLRMVLVAIGRRLLPDVPLADAAAVMFILPPPFVLPVFADDGKQRVYISSALTVSTIVTIAGFALLAGVRN